MWAAIQAFVDGAEAVIDEEDLFSRLERTARDLGYPYYAFGALWGDPGAMQAHPAPAVRLNYPPAWIAHYFQSGYDKIDPVVQVAPYAQTSVTWADLRHYRPDFFDEAAAHGLWAGIAIPLRSLQGCYVLCLATDQPREIVAPERMRLELLAHALFLAYARVRPQTDASMRLSDNTVQVIRLSMAGLSPAEIAERLGLTTHGVYWCIKDAKKRLMCDNQAQVYLKAIQQGIVAI